MTSVSKNVYINKLDDLVNKCNNTYHSTIKMKLVDIKSSTYINSSKEINDGDPKFKIGHNVGVSKYKNIFAKGYVPNWSEEGTVIRKVKKTVPWKCIISNVKGKETIGTFYKKELEKRIKKIFELKK